jgi:hypothetical protein
MYSVCNSVAINSINVSSPVNYILLFVDQIGGDYL